MAVQINVAANQAALVASIQAGVQAYNQRFASNNQINLNINARAFSQPLGRITGDVKDFEAALAASNARVIAFGASTAVLGGVIRSFKELAAVTIDVEKNLADINRVFGLSTSQLQKFSTELFNVSKLTASSFNDASKAALEFSRQGLKAEDTLQRTKDALTLTRLAGISTANAVDALTSTVNGFATTGVTTTQILNKLVAVEQDYAVGAGDLAEALSRTGQAAQEAGVSLDQLNALVTAAQQSTARGGAVIGNALKTIFTRLQRTETLDQLESFNIAVRDVQGNILPAVTILQNFAGAYKNLADAQKAQLSEQVAGVYQVNILKAVVNDLNNAQGVYAGALQRGASATNEAEVATAKLNRTLDALLSQTATSAQQLANNIGKVTFEPLARYGTEQLKSLVESMNEILEGEGVGSTFANGLLKGIRNILAGPGAIAAFFTLFKLIQNSFTYLSQALPQIAGITTETQNRKNIESAILQIMQQQGPLSQALAGTMGNQAAQAQLLLQLARQQTAEYQQQSALAKQLAVQLSGQGVKVAGARGLQVTRAGGYVPPATRMAEVVGAQAGGYSPGKVVASPVGGVMNTAEDVKYIPGFAQPFINPPANSKAGRAHRQNAISRTGVDPYLASGFIPNFAETGSIPVGLMPYPKIKKALRDSQILKSGVEEGDLITIDSFKHFTSKDNVNYQKLPNESAIQYENRIIKYWNYNDNSKLASKGSAAIDGYRGNSLMEVKSGGYNFEKTIDKFYRAPVENAHLKINQSWNKFTQGKPDNKHVSAILISPKFDGFIPNFAMPLSTARIPWFKKYSSKYKNSASDIDLFKLGDFPTYGRGMDHVFAKDGNPSMLSYLHEDFVKSAINIALGSKKVIRPAEVGFKDKPISEISNENDFDLLYRIADGSYSMMELKQDFKNVSGSITGFMNKKLANLAKENPELAKKVSSMIAVSNRPKFVDPTGRNAAGNLSDFEMAIAAIVKDKYSNVDPTISAKLTKVTDGLLRRYEAKKNTNSRGFIPNFAYKQAVMGLEESMSGNKAIFDTKPFPHIRNSSQPTFSSAIADHGGLSNALSDSMRGQKAVGLMSKGFIPNFARGDRGITGRNIEFSTTTGGLLPGMGSKLSDEARKKLIIAINDEIKSFKEGKISRDQLRDNTQKLMDAQKLSTKAQEDLTKKINANVKSVERQNEENKKSISSKIFGKKGEAADAFASSKLGGVAGLLGGALIGGQIESFIQGGRERYQLSAAEKFGASAGSGVLTAATTGAEIGAFIPVLGPAAGAAIGGLIGLGKAAYDAQETLDDMQKAAENYASITAKTTDAAKNYIQQLSDISNITNPADKNIASFKLQETFDEINKVSPELGKKFLEAGGDVTKMQDAIKEFVQTTNQISSAKKFKSSLESFSEQFKNAGSRFDQIKFLQKQGYTAEYNPFSENVAQITNTAGSLETSFRQFSGFLEIIRTSGMSAEQATKFMEEFADELSSVYVSESKLKQIGLKFGLTEELAADLASIGDNVIDEMGVAGKFFIKNSVGLVKKMFDVTAKSFKTSSQQFEFNAQPLLKKIEDSITDYVLKASSEIQNLEFQKNRLKLLEDAASNYLDSITSPIEKAARESSYKAKELQMKNTADMLKLSSDISSGLSNAPKVLGSSDVGAIKKVEDIITSIQTGSPTQQLAILDKLISQTKDITTAREAGFKVLDAEALKTLNKNFQDARGKIILFNQSLNESQQLLDLDNKVNQRRAIVAKQLLEIQNQLIRVESQRAINAARESAATDINEARFRARTELPGYGFGSSNRQIATERINAERQFMQERNFTTIQNRLTAARTAITTPTAKITTNLQNAILPEQIINLESFNKDIENTLLAKSFDEFSKKLSDTRSLKESISILIEFRDTLEKSVDINADAYSDLFKSLNQQITETSNELTRLNSETDKFNINLQKELKIADTADLATKLYGDRLNKILEIESAERRVLNVLDLQTQQIESLKSRPATFFGLGVSGKAEKQIDIENKLLEINQQKQRAEAAKNIRTNLESFNKDFKNQIAAEGVQVGGPYDSQAAREAILALNTDVTTVDEAKALADQMSVIRNEYGLQGKAADTLLSTENQIRSVLKETTDKAQQLSDIQAIINARVRQEAKDRQSIKLGFQEGFTQIKEDADTGLNRLAKETPILFRDGMVEAIKATVKETDNLNEALMGIAAKFLDTFSTQLMTTGVSKIISGSGLGNLFGMQKGGLIRAQNGMYISGSGSGDKYPAMLENGEYVLNRQAVMAMGGPSALDTLNFSMAPRFATGGSFKNELNTIQAMEANMTEMGLENSPYYKELNDAAKQQAEEDRRKKLAEKQQRAAMIGSLVAAAATIAIGAGISNVAKNAQASKAKAFTEKINKQGGILTEADYFQQKQFVGQGLMTPDTPLNAARYVGGTPQTGIRSLFSAPTQGPTWYQKFAAGMSRPFRKQTGGLIGSRLSDTVPAYMEGGLYNAPLIKKYSVGGLQSGGSSLMAGGNSSSTVNNNTSATNSFNFNTTVQRDGTINMGSNSTSYEQQDVELSKNLNNKIYAAVGEVIRKEKQFGGSLAGIRNS